MHVMHDAQIRSRVQYSRVAGTLSQSSCYYYKPHTTLSTTLYRTNTTPRVFWETDSTFYSSSFLTMQLLILLWLILRRSNGFFTDDSNHHYSNLLYTSPNHKMDGENFSRKLLMLWVLSSPPFPLCHHLALRAPSYAYNQYLPQHQKCKVKTRLSYSCGMMGGGLSRILMLLGTARALQNTMDPVAQTHPSSLFLF